MNLRRLKTVLLRLSLQEQVIGISAIVVMVGLFMPWYSMVQVDGLSFVDYGYSGDLGVIGFVIFMFGLFSLIYLLADSLRLPFPKMKFKREQILLFFTGEAAFLSLILLGVYFKRANEAFNGSIRFGLFMTLAAAFFGALASFSLIQNLRKKEGVEYFERESKGQESIDEEASHPQEKPEVLNNFQEDATVIEEIETAVEQKLPETEVIQEDEGVENIQEEVKEEVKQVPKKPITSQSDYFNREAGAKKTHSLPPSFYRDK